MLDVVIKKLVTMNPEDLTQGAVTEWVQTAIKSERDFSNFVCGLIAPNDKHVMKQGELNFVSEFQGL